MLKESKIQLYTMDRLRELGAEGAMREATEKLSRFCEKICVHVDVDVLEPSEMKALMMSVPGGLTLAECSSALRVVRETGKLCGLAVMVFDARKDPSGTEAVKVNRLVVDSLPPRRD